MKLQTPKFFFWQPILVWLLLANLMALFSNPVSWFITLSFFLAVPGYLLLSRFTHSLTRHWEIIGLSTGLSVVILMLAGLMLNGLHAFGVDRPLSRGLIFVILDLISLTLLWLSRKQTMVLKITKPPKGQIFMAITLATLPLLSIGGAIRLNNGASNILTMLLFAAISVLMIMLACTKKFSNLYPYALVSFGLSVLLSTSLRGWFITGHDIQHEFTVFQITSSQGFWNPNFPKGDPYNACLSITILPTLLQKLTSMPAAYIYKVVFQALFAFGLVPIYYFVQRLSNARKGLLAGGLFIAFPPFLNDMPFLNRQEIAFIFFGLILLVSLLRIRHRQKLTLSMLLVIGLILSHYSSGYVTLAILIISWAIYHLFQRRHLIRTELYIPIIRLPLIVLALLFTFMWNTQITASSGGLSHTISATVHGLFDRSSVEQSSGVGYSLFAPKSQSPQQIIDKFAGKNANQVSYVPETVLPHTSVGKVIDHVVSVKSLNAGLRSISAKLLQLLLLAGIVITYYKWRSDLTARKAFTLALAGSAIVVLILITLLPQLSVDYSVTRLFQQTLIISGLFIVIAADYLLGFLRRFALPATTVFVALFFLDLSGFVPQLLGGYPPQLSLNNSGTYYDTYYVHAGEKDATQWYMRNKTDYLLAGDSYSAIRFNNYPYVNKLILDPVVAGDAQYLYQDYANVSQGTYANFLSGNVLEYTYTSRLQNGSLLYTNQESRIYRQR